MSYGVESTADIVARNVRQTETGSEFEVVGEGLRVDITSSLSGPYNVSNCLAAIAATVLGAGVAVEAVARGIASAAPVPGRMERIDAGQDFTAIVDFAHTPNALRVALAAAREMVQRVCGGGTRDRGLWLCRAARSVPSAG